MRPVWYSIQIKISIDKLSVNCYDGLTLQKLLFLLIIFLKNYYFRHFFNILEYIYILYYLALSLLIVR